MRYVGIELNGFRVQMNIYYLLRFYFIETHEGLSSGIVYFILENVPKPGWILPLGSKASTCT